MTRFIWLNGFIAIFTLVFCLWAFLVALFDKQSATRIHLRIAVPWAKTILRVCGITVKTMGGENVGGHVPRIYMTNHQSYFDIFALLAYLPVDFRFILKQELMGIPFLGPAMRRAGYIGIQREDPRKAIRSINLAVEKIKGGASVVIFPEGTRSIDGKLQPFKKGGFNLALKSGCDIVPVTINGSHRIVPKGKLTINKGQFSLHIGKPVSVKGFSKSNVTQLMDRVREKMLNQLDPGKNASPSPG